MLPTGLYLKEGSPSERKRMVDKEVKTDVGDIGLREVAPGHVRFSIKAEDTLENLQVHSAFKEFCRIETDNNYTLGLKKLLEYYQGDFKLELLYNKMEELNMTLNAVQGSVVELQKKPQEDEDEEAF